MCIKCIWFYIVRNLEICISQLLVVLIVIADDVRENSRKQSEKHVDFYNYKPFYAFDRFKLRDVYFSL
jgi:hypothetical protein